MVARPRSGSLSRWGSGQISGFSNEMQCSSSAASSPSGHGGPLPTRAPPASRSLPPRTCLRLLLPVLSWLFEKTSKNTAGVRVLSVRMAYTHLLPSSQDPIFRSSTIWRESADLTRQTVSVRRARGQEVAGGRPIRSEDDGPDLAQGQLADAQHDKRKVRQERQRRSGEEEKMVEKE